MRGRQKKKRGYVTKKIMRMNKRGKKKRGKLTK